MMRRERIYRIDFVLLGAVTLLVFIGVLMIYSAGFDPIEKINSGLYKKQILWFVFGMVFLVGLTFVNYQVLGDYSAYIYIAVVVVLLFTSLFGTQIRNTRAWIDFGYFSIQPSEFMKLAMVILLAKYLEMRERELKHSLELIIPTLLTLIPIVIILIQPDFGTAVIFIPVLFTMLFVAGAEVAHLISVLSVAAIALTGPMIITYLEWVGAQESNFFIDFLKDTGTLLIVASVFIGAAVLTFIMRYLWSNKVLNKVFNITAVLSLGLYSSILIQNFFKTYQKKRILVFLNPDLDPHGSGYNIIQSKIAIGSGGFLGKGFLKGTQSQLGFLPEKTSDFIFAVVAEEWGFAGSVLVVGLLAVVVFRGIQISLEAKDKFGSLLAAGITSIFIFQILINLGMVVGIMPVTGLPLSFISYGGSNLIMSLIAVGILMNIRMKKFTY